MGVHFRFLFPISERTYLILSGTYRTEYTFNQVRALEYEATSFEHAGPMRQDTERSSDKHHGSKRKMATSRCDDNPRVQ